MCMVWRVRMGVVVGVLLGLGAGEAYAGGSIVGWGSQVVGVDLSGPFVAVAAGGWHSLGLKAAYRSPHPHSSEANPAATGRCPGRSTTAIRPISDGAIDANSLPAERVRSSLSWSRASLCSASPPGACAGGPETKLLKTISRFALHFI